MTASTNLRAALIQMASHQAGLKVEMKAATKESMTERALHQAGQKAESKVEMTAAMNLESIEFTIHVDEEMSLLVSVQYMWFVKAIK